MPDYVERDVPLRYIILPARPSRLAVDPEALTRLADDIAVNGLHQRIGVRLLDDGVSVALIFGQRRLMAFELLGLEAIPARVYPTTADDLHIRMSENELRENLNPIEQALECAAFLNRGEPLVHVARRFRRSQAWVEGRLALLDLAEDLQAAIASGALDMTVARQLATVDFAPYRAQLVDEALRTGANARTVAVWTAAYHADAARIKANTINVDEIVARREEYRVVARCPGCDTDHPFEATRALRLCAECSATILQAFKDANPPTP